MYEERRVIPVELAGYEKTDLICSSPKNGITLSHSIRLYLDGNGCLKSETMFIVKTKTGGGFSTPNVAFALSEYNKLL